MSRVDAVRVWRDLLIADVDHRPATHLSAAGLNLVLDQALGALTDAALDVALAVEGRPYASATVVAARTVLTAPIEWLALLLAHGSEVTLKLPQGAPGLGPWLLAHAETAGLPLTLSEDHSAVSHVPLVVAMGDDATIVAIGEHLAPGARLLGFGSRTSVAWAESDADAEALATDLAAHDGRGCMTPSVVLCPDAAALGAWLAQALEAAEARWPRGAVSDAEHASLRSRHRLAQATGQAWSGPQWSVHALPGELAEPVSLPRSVAVVGVGTPEAARIWLRPWQRVLSTLGLPAGADPSTWHAVGAPRVAPLGTMQAPPLLRWHDGVNHLRALVER